MATHEPSTNVEKSSELKDVRQRPAKFAVYIRVRLRTLRTGWSRANKLPRRLHFHTITSCANFPVRLVEDQWNENLRTHNSVHNYRYRWISIHH